VKNRDQWKPSKFLVKRGKLVASRDPAEVAVSSRLIADIVATHYELYIGRYARGKLLDLGCGKVPLFGAYRSYVTDNVCVDWSHSVHATPHLDFECDLTESLPFHDGEFDTIILSDVLEHIPEPMRLWTEMARLLTPEGRILMNVPFLYWLHEEPHDYYRYTEFALRRFATAAGMNVIQLAPIGGAPEVLADLLAKTVGEIPAIGRLFAASLERVTAAFLRTRLGRRASQRTGPRFPLGYFVVTEKERVTAAGRCSHGESA
jgi:SAM-dependent methyltransferase